MAATAGAADIVPSRNTAQIPSLKKEDFGSKATKTAIKAKNEAITIFKDLIFAMGFIITVTGIARISNHPIMTIMTVFCITAVKYVLKNSKLENLIDRVSHCVLVFFKNTLKPDRSGPPAIIGKKAEELETNKLIAELTCASFLPHPLTQKKHILATANRPSYVQYNVGEDEELEVEILPRKKDEESGKESALSEKEKLNTLIALFRRYPEIKTIRLPQVNNFGSFIPILENFPKLENLSLTGTNLIRKEIIPFLQYRNLTSLELRDCLFVDYNLWDEIIQETMACEFNNKILVRSNNREKMQNHFNTALTHKVISCTDKTKNELIKEFVNDMPQDSHKNYYSLVHLGVNLDLGLFSEQFETNKADSKATPEKSAKRFVQVFCKANFIVRELTSPFDLDEAFLKSIIGVQIKCLRAKHIEDVAALKNLPYLEELHLDFNEDIEELLKNLPDNIYTIVLKRASEAETESEPYLTLEKQEDQSYNAKVHKQGFGSTELLNSLQELDSFKINVSEVDLSGIGSFHVRNKPSI